jgi:hypothetical protein
MWMITLLTETNILLHFIIFWNFIFEFRAWSETCEKQMLTVIS